MVSIPVDRMTLREKLEIIDLLWSSISSESSEEVSPRWHGKELDRRLKRVDTGESVFEDWDAVKRELQELSR